MKIPPIMKRLLTKYARWYNIKYHRSGALIANRYKSQPVEVDNYFLLSMIGVNEFKEFHNIAEEEIFLVDDKVKITDEKIRREIIKKFSIEPKEIGTFDKEKRNSILRELKSRYSIRQIERVTGISRGIVHKS